MSSQWVTAVTRSFAMGCVAALVVGALWAPPAIAASGGAPLGPAPPDEIRRCHGGAPCSCPSIRPLGGRRSAAEADDGAGTPGQAPAGSS